MWETWVRSLGWEDLLEKEMTTHSSILAWRIPWTEELGGLQSMGRKELDTTERLHFHFHFQYDSKSYPPLCLGSPPSTYPFRFRHDQAILPLSCSGNCFHGFCTACPYTSVNSCCIKFFHNCSIWEFHMFFIGTPTIILLFLLWFSTYNFQSSHLLQCMCVCSCIRLFETPWTVAHQVPLSMDFSRQRILEWVAISYSRGSSQPKNWICTSPFLSDLSNYRRNLIKHIY